MCTLPSRWLWEAGGRRIGGSVRGRLCGPNPPAMADGVVPGACGDLRRPAEQRLEEQASPSVEVEQEGAGDGKGDQ